MSTTVKALVFDVFGTLVDWRNSVAKQADELATAKGITIDSFKFADEWRGAYGPSMNKVRSGEIPWTNLDDLHRMTLDKLLPSFGFPDLTEQEKTHFNKAWHRLDSWPDSTPGLTRLKTKYVISPLSNGNVALLTNMGKYAGLPWDCVLSAETFKHYKPDSEVYQGAASILGLALDEVMMTAAHKNDLKRAKEEGLSTAFVPRPGEFGPDVPVDVTSEDYIDVYAESFNELAKKMGC